MVLVIQRIDKVLDQVNAKAAGLALLEGRVDIHFTLLGYVKFDSAVVTSETLTTSPTVTVTSISVVTVGL